MTPSLSLTAVLLREELMAHRRCYTPVSAFYPYNGQSGTPKEARRNRSPLLETVEATSQKQNLVRLSPAHHSLSTSRDSAIHSCFRTRRLMACWVSGTEHGIQSFLAAYMVKAQVSSCTPNMMMKMRICSRRGSIWVNGGTKQQTRHGQRRAGLGAGQPLQPPGADRPGAPADRTLRTAGRAARWGFNFEVANYFALDEQGANEEGEIFATIGAEWSYEPIVPQVSDNREMLWVAGKQKLVDGQLKFEPTMSGRLDAGRSAYAAAGKVLYADSQASKASGAPDRFITYLWLTGDFYGTLTDEFPTAQQNWTGSLLLPRELSVGRLNVVDNQLSREKGSWRVDQEHDNGTVTLATLHQKIAREPYAAFQDNATNVITQTGGSMASVMKFDESPKSKHWMMTASITFPSRSDSLRAGFTILSGSQESTNIYYQFGNESLIIDRSNSSAAAQTTDGFLTEVETGKFRLFDVAGGYGNETKVETLDLTIVVDGGVVEVHANDRFAISTWVRSWYADSRDISFYVEGSDATFSNVTIYEGLVDAWPERN